MVLKINRQKKYFWLLSIFFLLLVASCLGFLWSDGNIATNSMMGDTMGSMMKTMHSPQNLSDLFQTSENVKNNSTSHHQSNNLISNIHYATTATIVCLLPIIIGGLVLLLIIWV